MAGLSKSEVADVAALARLEFSPDEQSSMSADLGQILSYVEKLQELDTTGIEPTAHAIPHRTPLRSDEPEPALDPELAVSNAPRREGTAFVVPKVIGEEEEG